jgi:hypothetical protein
MTIRRRSELLGDYKKGGSSFLTGVDLSSGDVRANPSVYKFIIKLTELYHNMSVIDLLATGMSYLIILDR